MVINRNLCLCVIDFIFRFILGQLIISCQSREAHILRSNGNESGTRLIRQIASNLEKQDNAKDENEQSGEDDGKRDENDIDGELHMNEPLVDAAKVLLGLFMWHEIVHEQITH